MNLTKASRMIAIGGKSRGVIIPKIFCDGLDLDVGNAVLVVLDDGGYLRIVPRRGEQKIERGPSSAPSSALLRSAAQASNQENSLAS